MASDLEAFRAVLDDGRLGREFPVGDAVALAAVLADLLGDPAERARLAALARAEVRRYDWSVVADDVLAVYETVTHGRTPVVEAPRTRRRRWSGPVPG